MTDFFAFLQKMGGLHDATVQTLRWNPSDQIIELRFDDIYSNFEGLPEYPGCQPAAIVLHGASSVRIDIECNEPLRVFEFLPHEDKQDEVLITFSPSGRVWVRFDRADYPKCELAGASS
jgi:hypothetical protein